MEEGVYDVVVVGSGAGGLTAALTAALEGASVTVLEHADVIGGTSARSSGTIWIPDSDHMHEAGVEDDRAAAERYLAGLVNGHGPRAMWEAFLDAGPHMLADLEKRADLVFAAQMGAPDYRQDIDGAAPGGRPLAPAPFDGRKLGADFARLGAPLRELMVFGGMMVTRGEAVTLLRADKSPKALGLAMRLTARYVLDRMQYARGTRLVMGNALVARLLFALRQRRVPVATGVAVQELVAEKGRVCGVRIAEEGRTRDIRARKGVVLAGGGYPASAEWRAGQLPEPTPEHTPAAAGCNGSTINLALKAGAVLGPARRDNALWFPSSIMKRNDGSTAVYPHIVLDRGKPGVIAVNRAGRRFVDEAVSYHEFVRAMYAANSEAKSIPAYLICTRAFIRRYGLGLIRPRTVSLRKYVANGYLTEASALAELAGKIDVPAEELEKTVARFNGFTESGVDADFHRGETIYDRAAGDPEIGPNPCLGLIGEGPFYALPLWPTPLGTSRGLSATVDAQAHDANGNPIPGLYACGNDMQSVFGGEYPGAGAQLGQAMTFGWLAARHAVGINDKKEQVGA